MNKQLPGAVASVLLMLACANISAQQFQSPVHQHGAPSVPAQIDDAQRQVAVDDHVAHTDVQATEETGSLMPNTSDHVMPVEIELQATGQAMDHSMHQQTEDGMSDQHMDTAAMAESDQNTMRDPHAYSNGYGLTSGPYALPAQRQVRLADERTFTGLWMDRLEYVEHDATQGTELEGFAWFGNSYRQILLQAQIETVEDDIEAGEIDLLYSLAVSPFWDLRFGMHRSFGENADRDWAAIGFKGLFPYWFEIDATLHLGDNGRAAFDFEAEYELLLTQRLVLQPRLDISAFSETDVELERGSGLSTIKAGARLRYELDRRFAPYVGVERVRRFGETADLLTLSSDRTETHWVLGVKFWF